MAKMTIRYTDYFPQVIRSMRQDGLLLVAADAAGQPNVMTIGWGAIDSIWGRPTFIVLVRPSRHTFSRLEETGDFTISVPPRELAAAVNLCGTVSGRDHDKFKEAGLTLTPSRQVRPPIITECVALAQLLDPCPRGDYTLPPRSPARITQPNYILYPSQTRVKTLNI